MIKGLIDFNGKADNCYIEINKENFENQLKEMGQFDLFESNAGLTIDGVGYGITIKASNINTHIKLNNPNTTSWKSWENKLYELAEKLAINSNNKFFLRFLGLNN